MNILVAPNSMKGSLSAIEFADTIEEGLLKSGYNFSIRKVPVADGGDGTGDILIKAMNLKQIRFLVKDPLQRNISAKLGFGDGIAVIEMSDASGMKLLKRHELNPLITTSFGTGQLILKALELGAQKIILCIGGSATVDGGMGMLEALGIKFFDVKKNLLAGNGKNLLKIDSMDVSELTNLGKPEIQIICDVTNPLLGLDGAANVFGPQKGATTEMVLELERGLANFAEIIQAKTGLNFSKLSSGGAAGGLAIGLVAFLDSKLVNGAKFILDSVSFNGHLQWSDVVITGEGKMDTQTLSNKAPHAVALQAKSQNKPTFAIVGQTDIFQSKLYKKIISLTNSETTIDTALKETKKLIFIRTRELADYLFSYNKL